MRARCTFLAAILLLAVSSVQARELLQECPIYKCASGCKLEDQVTDGVRRWVCNACQATYRLLSNKRGCVCPSGFVESSSGGCDRCQIGNWCPAGLGNGISAAQSANSTYPTSISGDQLTSPRSFNISCGTSMTTRLAGSREETSCVTAPGYKYNGAGLAATQCVVNTYNPGYNRLTACYNCPAGLTAFAGSDSKADCQVPAGYTMNRGVVTPCPKGTYRIGASLPTGVLNCTRCPRGWTTTAISSTVAADCDELLPGFYGTSGAVAATACLRGTYYVGGSTAGSCSACPPGFTTRNNTVDSDSNEVGAKSASECVNPPGYYNGTNVLTPCPNGTYAPGWARRNACTSCGSGISSDPNTTDEYTGGNLVRGAPTDCFIVPGQGMIFNRTAGGYVASYCPNNTYGATLKSYGLKFQPCKPCPRGLYSGPASSSESDCKNYAGYGFNGFTAEACPAGSYVAANSRLDCTECPIYRNTTATASAPFFQDATLPATLLTRGDAQDAIEDCKVIAGYGVVGTPSGNASIDVTMDVAVCEIGFYSVGGLVETVCTACTLPATTNETASTSCDMCVAGYGKSTNSISNGITCSGCSSGYYQEGGDITCVQCAGTVTYTYTGKTDPISTTAISRPGKAADAGAKSLDQCYPDFYQLDESMGTHIGNYSSLSTAAAANTSACAAACGDTCVAATWVYNSTDNSGNCYLIPQGTVPIDTTALAVKALPFDTIGGSSFLSQAAVASGSYVIFLGHDVADMYGKPIETIGATIGNSAAGTTHSATECKDACDGDSSCWGFYHTASGTKCYLRAALEAEGARTFVNVVGARVDTSDATGPTYTAYP